MSLGETLRSGFLSTGTVAADGEKTLADEVATLATWEPVVILVSSRDPGRLSGFAADLCHGIARRATLLRVEAALDPLALERALAGQLELPGEGSPAEVARALADRLTAGGASRPHGRPVLVCEAAETYSDETLERLRWLNNLGLSLVLVGRGIERRLAKKSQAALAARVTHRVCLDRRVWWSRLFWPLVLALVAAIAVVFWLEQLEAPQPSHLRAVPASSAALSLESTRPAPAPAPMDEDALSLKLSRGLGNR